MNTQIRTLLHQVYPGDVAETLAVRIEERMRTVERDNARQERWSASDIMLITYPDAFGGGDESPLANLRNVLRDILSEHISIVHLLPFYPYTSDDGFSVSNYREVSAANGTWADIGSLSQNVQLMFDLVINHASSAHPYFQDFLADRSPGNRYFMTATSGADVRGVTRPRASPLLQTYQTASGPKQVWCTFSRDQVDWDFSNPDVLYEFVDVFLTYIERGATWMRIDAIAYLWKELGTSCVHLPQTHAVVKLLRAIADSISSDIKLLTETNVPLRENLGYFGDGDEAHIVYNFPLPPLLAHGLLMGSAVHLTQWCQSWPDLPSGCTYLNFSASHDGIGLRPAEGILSEAETQALVRCIRDFGGLVTERQLPDGSLRPYEANVSLFGALKGTVAGEDEWQVERFLISQALMMSLAGVPAIYYNSMMAAPNNLEGLAETGRNRTINRKKWSMEEAHQHFSDPVGAPVRVLRGIQRLVAERRLHTAFHPESLQQCLSVDPRIFALLRHCQRTGQRVLCVFNLSRETVELERASLGLTLGEVVSELWIQGQVQVQGDTVTCSPYAGVWLSLGAAGLDDEF